MEDESNEARREAIRRAERQLAVNPLDQWTMAELAGMLIEVGQQSRAGQILQSFDGTAIQDVEIMAILGANHAELGEHAAAADYMCAALLAGFPRSRLHIPSEVSTILDGLTGCEPS